MRAEAIPESVSRRLAAWEIASAVMTVLVVEWATVPLAGRRSPVVLLPLAALILLLIASARLRRESLRALGLRLDGFAAAARRLIAPMLCGAIALVLFGWWARAAGYDLPRGGRAPHVYLLSLAWSLAQQYVLQAFVNRRAQVLFGAGARSVFAVALVFALLHLPNLPLALVTFAGGAVWARVYQQTPNLFALALSHALMSWLLIATIPASLLTGMRVGYNYFL